MKDLSEVLFITEIAKYVCLDKWIFVVPQMSLSLVVLEMVRWSHSMFCYTCSPPLAGSQRMMGNLAMFSKEKYEMCWWTSVPFSDTNMTHFTLTSISIWTKAAETNAVAANSMPTVILFKGLEQKTDLDNTKHIFQHHSHCSYAKRSIISYYVASHTWNWSHTFWWEGKLTGP